MFCGKCGSHIADGSSCCPGCGRRIAASGFTRPMDLDAPVQTHNNPPAAPAPRTAAVPVTPGKTGFCGHCGSPLQAGCDACVACGRPVRSSQKPTPSGKSVKPEKKKSKAPVVILLTFALLLIASAVALILYLVMGGETPETVAEQYINAIMKADATAVVNMLPDSVRQDVLEAADYDEDEQADFCAEKADDMKQTLSDLNMVWGPGWTYEIQDVEAYDWDESGLAALCELYSRSYDLEVEDAVAVEVDIYFRGQLGNETRTERVCLVQMNDQWYLDYLTDPDLFRS